jgi:hypothetical protein
MAGPFPKRLDRAQERRSNVTSQHMKRDGVQQGCSGVRPDLQMNGGIRAR